MRLFKLRFCIPGLFGIALLNSHIGAAGAHKERSGPSCNDLVAMIDSDLLQDGGNFDARVTQKLAQKPFLLHGKQFKKFYMWALDVEANFVDEQAPSSIAAMLKASDSDFVRYFSYLGVSKEKFTQIAQHYLDLMTEADLRYAPDHRPGQEVEVDRERVLEIDDELFGQWDNSGVARFVEREAPPKRVRPVKSPYNIVRPDQGSAEGLLGNLPNMITKSPKETVKWKADSQVPSPIVDEVVEPIRQTIKINEREVEVNEIQTFAEKEDYSRMNSGPAQFLEVLSLDGVDQLHFRYEYLGIGDQLEGHDSISNNAILKEVWIRSETGAWLDVTEHVAKTKIKYFYKSPTSVRAGDIEVNFVPLKDL